MIKFIKQLLGFGTAKETVKEILTPVVTNATPNSNKTLEATYIPPAKPINKVRAVGAPIKEGNVKGGNNIVKKPSGAAKPAAPTAPTANKPRRPYRGKPKAKPSK